MAKLVKSRIIKPKRYAIEIEKSFVRIGNKIFDWPENVGICISNFVIENGKIKQNGTVTYSYGKKQISLIGNKIKYDA